MAGSQTPVGEFCVDGLEHLQPLTMLPVALLSVYDKTGLLAFAQGLAAVGIKLLGSGGTAKAIRNAGMDIG